MNSITKKMFVALVAFCISTSVFAGAIAAQDQDFKAAFSELQKDAFRLGMERNDQLHRKLQELETNPDKKNLIEVLKASFNSYTDKNKFIQLAPKIKDIMFLFFRGENYEEKFEILSHYKENDNIRKDAESFSLFSKLFENRFKRIHSSNIPAALTLFYLPHINTEHISRGGFTPTYTLGNDVVIGTRGGEFKTLFPIDYTSERVCAGLVTSKRVFQPASNHDLLLFEGEGGKHIYVEHIKTFIQNINDSATVYPIAYYADLSYSKEKNKINIYKGLRIQIEKAREEKDKRRISLYWFLAEDKLRTEASNKIACTISEWIQEVESKETAQNKRDLIDNVKACCSRNENIPVLTNQDISNFIRMVSRGKKEGNPLRFSILGEDGNIAFRVIDIASRGKTYFNENAESKIKCEAPKNNGKAPIASGIYVKFKEESFAANVDKNRLRILQAAGNFPA